MGYLIKHKDQYKFLRKNCQFCELNSLFLRILMKATLVKLLFVTTTMISL